MVGGPVRDAVLGLPVANDLDFVLVGDAPALAAELTEELGGELTVHSRFGTTTVLVEGDRVDIVTARKEVYPSPGSLPEVSASTLNDDLARRDFSINAMALPMSEGSPEVIDPHGGLEDLANRLVTTLHPDSFTDDPTRLMRAVRYEQRLGFQISETTLAAMKQTLSDGHADSVSGDRWRQEFQKIFEETRAAEMLVRAIGLNVLPAVHPALTDGQWLTGLSGETSLSPTDYLAALAMALSAADGEGLSRRLNLPADWARVVRDTIALRESESSFDGQVSRIGRVLDGLDPNAIAAYARISHDPQITATLSRYLDEWRLVSPALTGDDLLAMGVPPGVKIGETLRELKAAKLDGLVSSEADERALVQQIVSRGN